jgi:hypothetical protein
MAKSHSSRNTTVVLEGFKPVDPSLPIHPYDDLTDRVFGKLTVKKYAGRRHIAGGTVLIWICKCDCGRFTLCQSNYLKDQARPTCGCGISKKNWKHKTSNIRHHPLYATWSGIVRRTNDSLAYIVRGMCDGFLELDHFAAVMGPKPSVEHSVDRIDNDGGYWCGCCDECRSLGRIKNVRWATQDVQCNNKSNNHRLTYKGKTMTISQWAKELRVARELIKARVEHGWNAEQIFETIKLKNQHSRNPIHHDEATQRQCAADYVAGATLGELGKEHHCDRHSIERLLRRMGIAIRNRSEWMKVGLAKKKRRRESRQRLLDFIAT